MKKKPQTPPPKNDEDETPFERFEKLARQIVNVPKEAIREPKKR